MRALDADELGVLGGAEFLVAQVGAVGIYPGNQPAEAEGVYFCIVVLSAAGHLDQPTLTR